MRISDWSSDDCADDEVAKIDAPVVVPVSPRIGGRCDRGHEKRCGGGARQSAGHVAHGNRLMPIYAPGSARCAVGAMNEWGWPQRQRTAFLAGDGPCSLYEGRWLRPRA